MESSPQSPASIPDSQRSDDVPTEPLNPSEYRMIHEHMTRRKRFLSDYERYNPVQNMHMLANHVFDLSESMLRMSNDIALNRRMLDLVSDNQREANESLRALGDDMCNVKKELGGVAADVGCLTGDVRLLRSEFGTLRGEVGMLKSEFGLMKEEMVYVKRDIALMKEEMAFMKDDMGAMKNEIQLIKGEMGVLHHEMGVMKNEVKSEIRELRALYDRDRTETQQGFADLKALMSILVGGLKV